MPMKRIRWNLCDTHPAVAQQADFIDGRVRSLSLACLDWKYQVGPIPSSASTGDEQCIDDAGTRFF
jgi:hypothetical protein